MGKSLPQCLFKKTLLFAALLFGIVTQGAYSQSTPNAWINEFHYDNDGGDEGEFVEIIIENSGNYSLSDFRVDLYNGSGGGSYGDETLDNFDVGDSEGNYTIYTWEPSSIQNGPDGIALSYQGSLLSGQFITYEGSFEATDGPASGETSTDIGVSETTSTPIGESLQLTGTGLEYGDFTWQEPSEESPGAVNDGQFLHPTIQLTTSNNTVEEDHGSITITAEITKPDGSEVTADIAFQTSASSSVDEDFAGSVTQSITFPSGATDGATDNATFTVEDDAEFEGPETAIFKLINIQTTGSAKLGLPVTYELVINDNDQPDVVINEILADPSDVDVDGNGTTNGTNDDEFIEILNNENREVDISGWTVSDDGSENFTHTFESGTTIPASSAIVLFSGDSDGEPVGSFGGSIVLSSDNVLSLNNTGDNPTLRDSNGNEIDSKSYESEGGNGESLVRDPEGSGSFVGHTTAAEDDSPFSPGTKIDGSNFANTLTIEGTAGWRMLSAPVDGMDISDLDVPIQGFGDGEEKNFYTGYDGTIFTAPSNLTGSFSNGKGFILYFFNNDQAGSSSLPVTLDATTGGEQTNDVTVSLHSSDDNWNLLGNPFDTAIDVSGIDGWVVDGTNGLESNVGQIWDPETNSYVTTTTNNDKVESWQGFFIQNNDASEITIPTSAKTTGTNFYKESHEKGYLALILKGKHSTENIETTDKAAVLYFHEDATHEEDQYDATKLLPFGERHALIGFASSKEEVSSIETALKAQESRPFDFEGELVFDLFMKVYQMEGDFELSWVKTDLPEEWDFTLIDNVTGSQIDMNSVESYEFFQEQVQKVQSTPDESEVNRSLPVAKTVNTEQEENPRFTIKATAPSSETSEIQDDIPNSVKLNPNYPNPFNPSTTIPYELTENAEVKLTIWNMIGQKVATLVDGLVEAGSHKETWNASSMPSGMYIARFEVGGKVFTRKMTLIK